jgi:hypothetical protein
MPNFKELTTKAVPPECTPRCNRRIAKAGMEFRMGDLAGRSTNKAMRSLGIIGKNQGIDQQAQEEYAKFFSEPLSSAHLAVLAALFGWKTLETGEADRGSLALAS